MLTIEPFRAEHLAMIPAREPDRSIMELVPDAMKIARQYEETSCGFTAFVDSVPMASAGIITLWPGLGEGWAYTSHLVTQFPCFFHKEIRRGLERIVAEARLHRVQISIPRTHVVSRRWATRLGFQKEGVMRMYGPDKSDYCRYMRLF